MPGVANQQLEIVVGDDRSADGVVVVDPLPRCDLAVLDPAHVKVVEELAEDLLGVHATGDHLRVLGGIVGATDVAGVEKAAAVLVDFLEGLLDQQQSARVHRRAHLRQRQRQREGVRESR